MAVLKYSRQREAIKTYLMNTKEHPTADVVYENIRKEYPNISLGTVYRNLSLLVELGEAIKVPSQDGCDHFDGDTSNHYHFTCTECGRILDLTEDMAGSLDEINKNASRNFSGRINGCTISFYGQCDKCISKYNS